MIRIIFYVRTEGRSVTPVALAATLDHRTEALDLVAAGAPIAVTMAEATASSPARPAGGRREYLDYPAKALDLVAAGWPIAVTTAEAPASRSTRPAG